MAKSKKSIDKTSQLVKKVGDHAVGFQTNSTTHIRRNIILRYGHVLESRRFVIGWLSLAISLIVLSISSILQVNNAASVRTGTTGGTYTGGMIGKINNLNPLFASGVVDESTSRLLFNGLLRYNTEGKLVGDLATSYAVKDDHKTYVVDLRKDVKWHDGRTFTAKDVVYTIKTIQNPATRSTRYTGWQRITVTSPSKYQVVFTLPATLASFPDALTVPIVPEHLLANLQPDMLRSSGFNTDPVGTGPFAMQVLRTDSKQPQLELKRNKSYYRGAPKIERFVLRTFPDNKSIEKSLKNRDITAAVGLTATSAEDLVSDTSLRVQNIPLYSGMFAFFKTTNPILSDVKVRQALVQSFDRQAILKLFHSQYPPLKTPLFPSQLGYSSKYAQITNPAQAATLLDSAGWAKQANGKRVNKDGTKLELSLVTVDSDDQMKLATELQKQWAKAGVTINIQFLTPEQLSQTALATHSYDILLYGISIDHDPDVFAYWHSSQALPGASNFSEWKSSRADINLEIARTRLEDVLRIARYQTFQDEWQKSAPALALYQLETTYASHENTSGFVPVTSTNAADRLTNVEDWTVATKQVPKTP